MRRVVSGHPVAFGRPSTRTRQGPSFPGEEDGFDLARLPACCLPACPLARPENKTIETHGARGTWKRSVCGARLMVRRSMNPLPLTPPPVSPRPIISRTSPSFGRGRTTSPGCSTEVVSVRPPLPGVPKTLDQDVAGYASFERYE